MWTLKSVVLAVAAVVSVHADEFWETEFGATTGPPTSWSYQSSSGGNSGGQSYTWTEIVTETIVNNGGSSWSSSGSSGGNGGGTRYSSSSGGTGGGGGGYMVKKKVCDFRSYPQGFRSSLQSPQSSFVLPSFTNFDRLSRYPSQAEGEP